MRVGSLFTGIGGLDLGLERAGMTVVWQSEIDPYACKVLARHWPHVPNLGDITEVDWTHVERPDLVCGGYPCQPFSLAGTRQGDTDPRHLWPHFADCLRHLRPRWALLENVPGHLSLGFGRVLGDLAELGYHCEWDCIPASAVGAPHLRYRVFVVAHADESYRFADAHTGDGRSVPAQAQIGLVHRGGGGHDVPDAERDIVRVEPIGVGRSDGAAVARDDGASGMVADTDGSAGRPTWGTSQAVLRPEQVERPGRCRGSFGDHWAVEPDVGRVADGVPHRVDRLRTLGNAVVPQVAELIGHHILEVS